MGRYKSRRWWEEFKEKPKDHAALPDDLGLGIREERDATGQIFIYLMPSLIPNPYIVLGKYAEVQEDGSEYYVADWTWPGVNHKTNKHIHLIMAMADIHRIIEENDKYALRMQAGRSASRKDD